MRDMDWIIWLRAGTGECGNEPSGSVKCGEFLEELKNC
jgi:hypothetical protein